MQATEFYIKAIPSILKRGYILVNNKPKTFIVQMKMCSAVKTVALLMNWFKCHASISRLELPITTTTAARERRGEERGGAGCSAQTSARGREEKRGGMYSLL